MLSGSDAIGLAGQPWELEIAGSSPVSPTNFEESSVIILDRR